MNARIRWMAVLTALALAACFGGGGDDTAGGAGGGAGDGHSGSGGGSGHTITGGDGGSGSGVATAGAGGGTGGAGGVGGAGGAGAVGGADGVMNASDCPAEAPIPGATFVRCDESQGGMSCSYASNEPDCTESFECECVSESPGVACFWSSPQETCGSGGAGGSGGNANPCPPTPPENGTPCTEDEAAFCTYHDCGGAGETNARCQAPTVTMWLVDTKPCEPVTCVDGTLECPVGQVCEETRGGALGIRCIDDPCGDGPQNCGCSGVCDTCTYFSGNTIVCSIGCPPGEECL